MSSYWNAYYGDALILNEEEFDAFCKCYAKAHQLEEEFLGDMEYSIEEYEFIQSREKDKTFQITRISADDTDGKFFIPFIFDGKINKAEYDEAGHVVKEVKSRHWREHDCYAIFADRNRYLGNSFFVSVYRCYNEFVQEFKGKLENYLPDDFNWDEHLGIFSYAAWC